MGWLIDKIREWFCEHEWECLVDGCAVWSDNPLAKYPRCYKWVYVCKKCKRKKVVTSE